MILNLRSLQPEVVQPESFQPGLIVDSRSPKPEKEKESYGVFQWNPPYVAPQEPLPERTICGLRVVTFGLLVAIIALVIAAAVGGGVGGSIAVKNAKTQCLQQASAAGDLLDNSSTSLSPSVVTVSTPSTSSSATSTSSTSSSTSSSSTSSTSSASSSSTSMVGMAGTTAWGPLQTAFPYTGCPDINGTTYTTVIDSTAKFNIVCGLDIPNTGSSDLLNTITPTFELCMETCASWNAQGRVNGGANKSCAGVAFIPSHVNGDGGGKPIECVLKNYAVNLFVNPGYLVDSAVLIP